MRVNRHDLLVRTLVQDVRLTAGECIGLCSLQQMDDVLLVDDIIRDVVPVVLVHQRLAAHDAVVEIIDPHELHMLLRVHLIERHRSQDMIEERIAVDIVVKHLHHVDAVRRVEANADGLHTITRPQHLFHAIIRERPVIVVALHVVDAERLHHLELGLGLHALTDHRQIQEMRHVDDGLHDLHGLLLVLPLHELHVELQDVELHVAEGVQVRVAGAEIVEVDAEAELTQTRDGLLHAVIIIRIGRLRDLDADHLRIDSVLLLQ